MELHQLPLLPRRRRRGTAFRPRRHRLQMLPSALGRQIRLLEEDLRPPVRADDARRGADRGRRASRARSARPAHPGGSDRGGISRRKAAARAAFSVSAHRQRSSRSPAGAAARHSRAIPRSQFNCWKTRRCVCCPKILSGALDLAFVRPPERRTGVSNSCRCSRRRRWSRCARMPSQARIVSLKEICRGPLIVPDRRSRPHSHDLTMRLFAHANLRRASPRSPTKSRRSSIWSPSDWARQSCRAGRRIAIPGVICRCALVGRRLGRLPLAAVWLKGSRDETREAALAVLRSNLDAYAKTA